MNQGKGAAAGCGSSFRYAVSGLPFSADIRATRGASTTGDEPFYLLTAQSLLADGDFDLRNQYETRSYESFFDHPDGLWQQSVPLPDGDLLSPHNPGLSILLIPGFALGGLVGAQVQFLLLAAAAMALAFVLADRLTGRRLVSWVISLGVNSRDLVPPVQQQGRHSCPNEASTSRQQNFSIARNPLRYFAERGIPPKIPWPLTTLGFYGQHAPFAQDLHRIIRREGRGQAQQRREPVLGSTLEDDRICDKDVNEAALVG